MHKLYQYTNLWNFYSLHVSMINKHVSFRIESIFGGMLLWPHKVEQQTRAGGHILDSVFQLVCSLAGPMPYKQSLYPGYQAALLF